MAGFDRHFQIIFEHSPVGLAILDSTGRIMQANAAVQRMLGYADRELRSDLLVSHLDPADVADFEEGMKVLSEGEEAGFRLESRLRTREGAALWARIDVSRVRSSEVSPFVFVLIDDVTAHKSGVEKLRREKESAEKATQTKSAFLANMSHEIRTPIHTITGMSELLLETRLDAEQREYATQVQFSAEVLLGLINDILDFSKIEAGKLGLEVISCAFRDLAEDAVEMTSLLAHKKGLEVVVDLSPDVPEFLSCDPLRVRQVIINLFNNAIKFTARGEIVVRGRTQTARNGRRLVVIEVVDTGIGIPEDKQRLLFNAFTQVDSSTTRKFGGTGLGLSISKNLVRMWGGTLGVRSQPGEGATFWFTLPVVGEDRRSVGSDEGDDLRRRRLLIVDDNDTARKVLFHQLSRYFLRLETARSGADGIERLRKAAAAGEPFDLALVDLLMPGMDGWQLASEVNSDKDINATKLILMSPTGAGSEAKMKLLGWFNAYVAKPIRIGPLIESLRQVMSAELDLPTLEETPEASEPEAPRRETYRILVAEDHPVNQHLFQTILERMGHVVTLASDGGEAVEAMRAGEVDLIFMDIQMPGMNGIDATREIRRGGFDGPIVAVTANALKGEKDRCLQIGMNDYLTKPFKPKDLVPILDKWLHEAARGTAPSGPYKTDPVEVAPRRAVEDEALPAEKPPPEPDLLGDPLVFDFPRACEAFMGKQDIVVRVVKAFIVKMVGQMQSMRRSLDEGNWDALRIESHGIKGGSWNLEARRLGDEAAGLEAAAKDHNREAAERYLENVDRAFAEFQRRVTQLEQFKEEP